MPQLHLWKKREVYLINNEEAFFRYNSFRYKFGPHSESTTDPEVTA
jgi:hypothetical protein